MSLIPGIFEFISIASAEYFFYKFSFPLVIILPLSFYGFYLYSNSRFSYSNQFMKGTIYDPSYPQDVHLVASLPIPSPQKNQVLIKVKAASLNPVDYKLITPKLPFVRWFFPHTVGRDFAGQIIQLGPGVTSFNVNDEVFGNATGGSFQEFTIANVNEIALKPKKLNWEQAGGLGLAPATSLQSLRLGKIKKGANVLIIGASGGTGRFGVVIAKHYEARVVGVCSAKNVGDVKKLGADKVIDYTDKNFMNEIKDEKFDVIYDCVTSPEDKDQTPIFKPYLKGNGRYVAINGSGFAFFRGFFGIPVDRHYLLMLNWNRKDLEIISGIMEGVDMSLLVDSVYGFGQKDIEQIFERQKSRRAKGKIILSVSKD